MGLILFKGVCGKLSGLGWLRNAGWTPLQWQELVNTVKAGNIEAILKVLKKYKENEFGTPLALDIMKVLGTPEFRQRELVGEYLDSIPVREILNLRGVS